MLAVPMNTYRYDYHYDEDGRYHYEYQWVSKLVIVNISEEEMQIHGEVNHSKFYETDDNHWWIITIFDAQYLWEITSMQFPMLE